MEPFATVILAAGTSQRFGSIKQLADIQGKYLLQGVLDNCQPLQGTDIFVLLGANSEKIQSRIQAGRAQFIFNQDWRKGIGSSIRTATRQLQDRYPAILFVAGDQPLISGGQLSALTDLWRATPQHICAAEYKNSPGIPALFPSAFYSRLLALDGDHGAKALLLENRDQIRTLQIPQGAFDIDRPEDIESL